MLFDNNDSYDFRQPVDYIGINKGLLEKDLGLTDYPNVVKTPMDLGTVREKLNHQRYN